MYNGYILSSWATSLVHITDEEGKFPMFFHCFIFFLIINIKSYINQELSSLIYGSHRFSKITSLGNTMKPMKFTNYIEFTMKNKYFIAHC